jgi:hypothetical protein
MQRPISLQVALAIRLEGGGRQSEGETAAELLAVAADVWQHSIRPMHREQESYHEGQVCAVLFLLLAAASCVHHTCTVLGCALGPRSEPHASPCLSCALQIASALSGLGRFHVKQDVMSGYSVDLCLPEGRVAIEADGPSHFSRNTAYPAK